MPRCSPLRVFRRLSCTLLPTVLGLPGRLPPPQHPPGCRAPPKNGNMLRSSYVVTVYVPPHCPSGSSLTPASASASVRRLWVAGVVQAAARHLGPHPISPPHRRRHPPLLPPAAAGRGPVAAATCGPTAVPTTLLLSRGQGPRPPTVTTLPPLLLPPLLLPPRPCCSRLRRPRALPCLLLAPTPDAQR